MSEQRSSKKKPLLRVFGCARRTRGVVGCAQRGVNTNNSELITIIRKKPKNSESLNTRFTPRTTGDDDKIVNEAAGAAASSAGRGRRHDDDADDVGGEEEGGKITTIEDTPPHTPAQHSCWGGLLPAHARTSAAGCPAALVPCRPPARPTPKPPLCAPPIAGNRGAPPPPCLPGVARAYYSIAMAAAQPTLLLRSGPAPATTSLANGPAALFRSQQ